MMNFESKIIKLINDIMPDSPLRKSNCFEVDSEVIQLGDEKYLFTTDDFSAEDLFRDDDPYTLGWNIACASISDIIASGGKPLVYSHSMVISKAWDEKFIEQFSKGISEVLKIYSVSFIGGDLGISENWRYTSTVIGKPMGKMINRKGIGLNDTIFITGKIGAGNLQAAMNLFSHDDRVKEMQNIENDIFRTNELLPEILTEFASASIDTSDGVFSALRTLSELNGKGFRINALPYIGNGINISEALKLPIELFFLGECGEYEILFTVNENKRDDLLEAAREKKIDIFEIGKFTDDKNEKIISMNNKIIDLNHYDLNARDFTNVRDYLNKVIIWLNSGSD